MCLLFLANHWAINKHTSEWINQACWVTLSTFKNDLTLLKHEKLVFNSVEAPTKQKQLDM